MIFASDTAPALDGKPAALIMPAPTRYKSAHPTYRTCGVTSWIWESRAVARWCAHPARVSDAPARSRWRRPAATAAYIRQNYPDVEVTEVVGDITTVEGRETALAAAGQLDILVNNAGGPPPGDFRNWTRDDWLKAIDANMLTPIELIKATVDGMMARKWGRIVNITSAAVKAPIDVLGLSNGARSGLTGFIAGLSRKTVRENVTINGLLPGPFNTDRLQGVAAGQVKATGLTIEEILAKRASENPSGRFGDPEEFGLTCAFLCGDKAGFITGQNIVMDGGAFPGTM
jgi:3-oxoacyl-[acyl-carrier protein] reductase